MLLSKCTCGKKTEACRGLPDGGGAQGLLEGLEMRRWIIPLVASSAAVLLAVALLSSVQRAAEAASNGQSLGGGVKSAPSVIASDRHPFALAYTLGGLNPGRTYSVKTRLEGRLGGQFGSTWNARLSRWVSTASAWSLQTTITADASGAAAGWLAARAGSRSWQSVDETATLCLVTREEGAASNLMPPDTRAVSISPVAAGGLGLLHGAARSSVPTPSAMPVSARDSGGELVGLVLAEPNAVDDDDNGVVDDEGVLGLPRSFRIAVPSSRLLSLHVGDGNAFPNQVAFAGLDLAVPREGRLRALSASIRPARPLCGSWAELKATLEDSGEETLSVEMSQDGVRWVGWRAVKTDEAGYCSLSLYCRRTLRYRAVWLGTPTCPPSVTPRILLPVLPRLYARLGATSVRRNQALLVRGSFRPFRPGRVLKVLIISTRGGRWVSARRLTSTGFVYPVRIRRPGVYRIVVLFEGDGELARTCVAAGRVRVR